MGKVISKERTFPPHKISNLGWWSASNFLALVRDTKHLPVTLIIGAGLSASAGLPSWRVLLQKICAAFFCHWEYEIAHENGSIGVPPRNLSISFYEDIFWSDQSIAAAEKLVEQDALLVAQQVKNCIRDIDWRYLLHKLVYNYDNDDNPIVKASVLIQSLVEYCAVSQNLQAIISYNWDNVFEREVRKYGVDVSPIWENKQTQRIGSLPMYYPHGYLPQEGGPVTKIVLAESDYQQETKTVYSWANLLQIQAFCSSVCIFLGTSMTDRNLRRLLHVSTENMSGSHYAFLPSQHLKEQTEIMREALFDRDLQRLGVKVIRYPVDNSLYDPYSRLPELVELMRQSINDKDAIWVE